MGNGKKEHSPRRRSVTGRITLREVAEAAGVSPITASRVLSGAAASVSQQTKERVNAAADELGYVPNRLAEALASASSPVVPVLVPALRNAVFSEIIEGLQGVLQPRNLQIFIGSTQYSLDEEARLLTAFLGWSPRAVVLTGTDHATQVRRTLKDLRIPVVEVMDLAAEPLDLNVGFSHFAASFDLTTWLVGRGYRRIGFVGAYLDRDLRARRRLEGFRAAMEQSGFSGDAVFASAEASNYVCGAQALEPILANRPRLDAVFCANDILAAGLIFECQRRGVPVPDQLAVAGFNDLPISEVIHPTLTTVATPRLLMGRLAAQMLLDRLDGKTPEPAQQDVGYSIIPRESA